MSSTFQPTFMQTLAQIYGTPLYVYDKPTLQAQWQAYDQALQAVPHLICYAVKANSNLSVLKTLADLGSGFDIVSIGELERVLAAGGDPAKTVFSGVAKTKAEMERALMVGIRCFNVESAAELQCLANVATEMATVAPVSFRVNPDVNPNTHPYISTGLKENKFGVAITDVMDLYQQAQDHPWLNPVGMDVHIGSQLTEMDPYVETAQRLKQLLIALKQQGIHLKHLDMGGGIGVRYTDETPMDLSQWTQAILTALDMEHWSNSNPDVPDPLEIVVEPGRSIAANAGVLLTQTVYLKPTADKHFAIVDAGMNDLIRPSLYSATQHIENISLSQPKPRTEAHWDVVGPVCESSDFLGKNRPMALAAGDLLMVHSAGAYGFVMASNYNSRPMAAEVMIDGEQHRLIRPRQTLDQLFADEAVCLTSAD